MIAHPNRNKTHTQSPLVFSLSEIRAYYPCEESWVRLRKALPAKSPLALKISLGDIAKSNGAADALWCIRVLDWSQIDIRRAVIAGAVLPAVMRASVYTTDERAYQCIRSVDAWCRGDKSIDLRAVAVVARAAAEAAWGAEAAGAWAASRAVAQSAEAARAAGAICAAEAAGASRAAAEAAGASRAAAERDNQVSDIIRAFPAIVL